MTSTNRQKYMDVPELFPPFDSAFQTDHADECCLCNSNRYNLRALDSHHQALKEIIENELYQRTTFPRTLSEYHWFEGMREMAINRRVVQKSGDWFSSRQTNDGDMVVHDNEGWVYYLYRDQLTRKGKEVRQVYRVSIQIDDDNNIKQVHVAKDELPPLSRCLATNSARENSTGKGVGRYTPQCKNKTYDLYCHAHR